MPPSAATADPTADQNATPGPTCPGTKCKHTAGVSRKGAALKRGGPAPNSPMSELGQLMEEPAGGANHGRRASENPEREGQHVPLGAGEWQAAEFMRSNGWRIVEASRGRERGGDMTAHRGVLHPDEYVDAGVLREMVERELGFSYEQVRSVFRQGRVTADQRELRGRIDARLLALSRSGSNLALLGWALGFPVKNNGNCRVMENALARARAEEVNA